ncbi:hypothetical protein [Paenibacillus donghaensis]|uniref:Uncharacterized protein n=1 Tax=Paenibacillus donghaensis TaxID=414771 RepID=A0A2Z2K6H1_9BACL|nr:hypothetical protein [Paenibacillus donghaensis]ASA20397.1 hypothetical protein B9T62_06025 [Paenibacillus donghaensis]
MKILFLYILLALLVLLMIVSVDLLSGMSIAGSLQSITSAFATTTLQESIIMVAFLLLPLCSVLFASYRKKKRQRSDSKRKS